MRIYKAKAPMRIGFFGGGTDVSPYAEEHGGKVLNCTIDKYVRCMLRPSSEPGIIIRSLDWRKSVAKRPVTGMGASICRRQCSMRQCPLPKGSK
jgi:Predicted kinase related to galactokinase and mevalonate kinase